MDQEALKKKACAAIDHMSDALISASHAIHAKPELAFEEHFAHGLLSGRVEEAGLPVERGACGLDTAFVSSFGEAGVEVGIISEYDALPGIGHACGHNIIATSGLGAALALSKLGAALPGRVCGGLGAGAARRAGARAAACPCARKYAGVDAPPPSGAHRLLRRPGWRGPG